MSTYEFRVWYRRSWWTSRRSRLFQTEAPAHRLADKLRRPWRNLAPVTELTVQRRAVGEWSDVPLIDVYQPPRGRR